MTASQTHIAEPALAQSGVCRFRRPCISTPGPAKGVQQRTRSVERSSGASMGWRPLQHAFPVSSADPTAQLAATGMVHTTPSSFAHHHFSLQPASRLRAYLQRLSSGPCTPQGNRHRRTLQRSCKLSSTPTTIRKQQSSWYISLFGRDYQLHLPKVPPKHRANPAKTPAKPVLAEMTATRPLPP